MLDKGAPGWVVVTEGIGFNRNDHGSSDYRYLSDKGLGVMVRLNAGYSGTGTIPHERNYQDFAQRCANFVRNSHGAHIWIIGNEMNHPVEWPGADWDWGAQPPAPRSAAQTGEAITPQRYVQCYRLAREAIRGLPGHSEDQVLIGAVAPWNNLTKYQGNEGGDWILYFRDILTALGPDRCDGITIHTYTHGPQVEKIDAETRMGAPFQNRRYEFRTYIDFMEAIPATMRHLPVYITETDQDEPWVNENSSWVRRAYGEIDYWNKNNAQQIRALVLYRWPRYDKWYIEGKQGVIEDFRMAMDWKLKWRTDVAPQPEKQPYRADIRLPQPLTAADAGATLTVAVTVRNTGRDAWPRGGPNPVRLGYRWYDAGGQQVAAADHRTPLPRDVAPGEEVQISATLAAPAQAGTYTLSFDLVHEGITWFADKGNTPAKARVAVSGAAAPAEQYFAETKVWVRGAFLDFYRRYGLDICGYPITEVFSENGMKTQYFQRVALEEYEPGKVRLRLTAQQALEASQRITALEQQIAALRRQLQSGGGAAPQPPMQDVSQSLPRDVSAMITRPLTDVRHIVINHTAVGPDVGVERIAQAHRKTWPAIVCQFFIDGAGNIVQTNPLTEVVSSKDVHLRDAINIHVAGNFSTATPSANQIDALASLCAWLLDMLGLETTAVQGAREFVVTQSPGNNWMAGANWKQTLVDRIAPLRGSGAPSPGPTPGDGASAQEVARLQRERDELADHLLDAHAQIDILHGRVMALEAALAAALQGGGGAGGVQQPAVRDVISNLPRAAERMVKRKAEDVRYIVINHTAVPPTVGVERVAQAHAARWPAIVSQFFIDGEGAILQTNPLNEVVDDKQEWILRGVNIHVAGNFNDALPSEAQLDSLARLCAWLLASQKLPDDAIRGASEFIVTQSPGAQWLGGQRWKDLLLQRVQAVRATAGPGAAQPGSGPDPALLNSLRQQISQLQAQNQELARRLQDATNQLAALPAEAQALKAQVTTLQREKTALEGERNQARTQAAQLQTQIEALNRQVQDLNKRLQEQPGDAGLRAQIATLEKEKTALAAERDRQQQSIAALQKRVAELEKGGGSTPPRDEAAMPGKIAKPPMVEVVDQLMKHPTETYPSRELTAITHIAIHHSAAPANIPPERIAIYHVTNEKHKWPGMGYHYYIGPDGVINHTQDLKLASYQVYKNNHYSLGICVAGNFTDVIPTPAQVESAAHLTAWLMQELHIPIEQVWGHREFPLNSTSCPGNQWLGGQKWKDILLNRVREIQGGISPAQPSAGKAIEHYLLFWHHGGNNWAQQDWQAAINYIAAFQPTAGFSLDAAKAARYVTIVGGTAGVSQQIEDAIRTSGSRVERLAGRDFAETKALLDQLAASGRKFMTI